MRGSASDKICDAMLMLLKEKPLEKITVKELTITADVNRSSYSYHFYDKEDVIEAIFSRFNSELNTVFLKNFHHGVDMEKVLDDVNISIYEYVLEHIDEVTTLIDAGFEAKFMHKFVLAVEEFFHHLEFNCLMPDESIQTLNIGSVYDLKIKHMVYTMLADIEHWGTYRYALSARELAEISRQADEASVTGVSFKSHGGQRRI